MLPISRPQILMTINNERKFHVGTAPTASPAWFSHSPLLKAIVALQQGDVVGCTALHVI